MHDRSHALVGRSALLMGLLCIAATAMHAQSQGFVSADLSKFRNVGQVALSPDGRTVAYTVTMRNQPRRPYSQLWIMDLATQKATRVGDEKSRGSQPQWSPDGR